MRLPLFAAALILAPLSVQADDITDALSAAIEAYEAGDIADAQEEIAYASQLLDNLQAAGLTAYLPPALPGWTQEVNADGGAAAAIMGGTAAEATYRSDAGSFTVMIMVDSPLVASMAGILGNSALMRSMGQIERINRENFMLSDGELTGLLGGRILLQASGGTTEDMVAHLEQMDFRELEDFGR